MQTARSIGASLHAGAQPTGAVRPFVAAAAASGASRQQRLRVVAAAAAQQQPGWGAVLALGPKQPARLLSGGGRAPGAARRSRRLVVRANWGAPVEFSPAKVVSNAKDAELLHRVVIDVGDLAAGYTTGGQFMQIKVGEGKPGFFAIASPPDPNNQGLLEFLIKAQGEAASALAALGAGAEVSVSPVMGKGFPVDKIPAEGHPTVLLFATGSGISPIKALIESGALDADQRKDVRLYYGTRGPAHTAYADAIPRWEKAGVKVVQVFSDGAAEGARYVQDVFGASPGISGAGAGVGVVLCGHKGMCEAVKELVAAEGVDGDKVLLNF